MTRAQKDWWRRYSRYLNSEGWQLTREACFRRDGYCCRRCGAGQNPRNPLQANHLSYDAYNRTGRTPLADLETLCMRCHDKYTGRRWRRWVARHTGTLIVLMIMLVFWIFIHLHRL